MSNILITGCSMGIGFATALELARAGHHVIATMRNPAGAPRLGQIAAEENLPIEIRALDVDSDETVRACFAGIDSPIDVLVNNAGIEVHGSLEELPMESIIAVMNTNYFGTVRCIKAVLPGMRERRSGCIINISSVSGRISSAPLGPYAASKHAVEAISEALAGEVKPYGIRVAVVQPGIQNTRMAQDISYTQGSPYPHSVRFAGLFRAALSNPTPPEVTAGVVRNIVESGTWQLRHLSGPDAGPFLGWRASQSDEQWVDWSAQDDESWYAAVERDFGMNARPLPAAPASTNSDDR
ncbi:MAG: SDR family oxidoreductase [Bryobacterales bacterium]|nr:SDR family oxidoreductase [Bryobacterales bacterium]